MATLGIALQKAIIVRTLEDTPSPPLSIGRSKKEIERMLKVLLTAFDKKYIMTKFFSFLLLIINCAM